MERKMHCVLEDISTDSPEALTPGKDSPRNQEQLQISTTPLKDCGESALSGRNSDSSCPILAFLTFEPDGNWKIVALPVWCLGHTNLASGVVMDGLQLVLPTPLNRSKIDQHKGFRANVPDYGYSLKSFMGRSNAGSNVYRRCQNKIANRAAKLNEISGNSCSHPMISSNSSDAFADNPAEVNSSDTFMSNSKAEKPLKKNSRKKAKKKGRQSKKQSSDSSSTEPEVLSEVYGCAGLASEACGNNDAEDQNMLISYKNGSGFSSSNHKLIQNDSERHGTDNRINLVESPKTCTSSSDEVEMPEATTSMVQKSTGDDSLCNSNNQLQNSVSEFAVTEGKTKDMQQNHSALYTECLPGMQDSLGLDSVSAASNSDGSTNADVFEKQSNNAVCRTSCSEPPVSKAEDGYLAGQGLSDTVGNDLDRNEGIKYVAQNYSIGDKRVKQKRTSPRCVNRTGAGNFHFRTGKENSHSVWQKVQKHHADECNGDSKKVNASLPQCNSSLKKAPSVNRNCNSDCANSLSKTDDKKHSKSKVNRKSKGKMDSDSKKGYCSYSRKGSHLNRSIFNGSAEDSLQLNDMLQVSSQENSQEVLCSVSESHSHFSSPKVELETKGNQQITSESVDDVQIHQENSDLPKDVLHNISSMKNQNTENLNSSSSTPSDIDQSTVSEEQSAIYSHLSGHEVYQTEKEASSAAYNVQNNGSGSILWKWIPIGKKDTGLAISGSDTSTPEYSDEPPHEDSMLESDAEPKEVYFPENKVSLLNENNVEPQEISFLEKQVSSSNESITCMDQISNGFSGLDEDENKQLGNQVACNLSEHKDKHVVDNHLIYERKNRGASENYSFRIAQAINDACRVQLECEAVHMATGGPIAEVERLLHKCSPFICQSSHSLGCLTFLQDDANGATLCRHVAPDLTLGCLWQWYEKHGSYGLEIRAQDYNSRRLGGRHVPFRAYFVPSLSAVQLFKDHKVQCTPSRDMSEHSSASAGQHPNFSGCFPQPWNQDTNIPIPQSQIHCSELSSSATDNGSGPSVNSSYCGDLELLFEYFESEQPQQRQPLYEKIEELVRGFVSSQSRVYGDPTVLDSVNLQDLHPRSWFSVAWYPIYRIPCGNFRAAFLTYHSLGHLVHRSIKNDSSTLDSCIVSPAVGLQSYNAQGECWFQLSQSAQAAEMLGLNPSTLLKERLCTLEETASLMSRSIVTKGNSICTSIHPDYEFFRSRRRY